jgi:tRNA-dihydrouridine synthase
MSGFWTELKKPILCLAPMADVTDAAFRKIISKYSKIPHVTFTEFVSADGLVLAPEEGRKKLLKDLEYSEIERPTVAQFFSGRPGMIEKAAELAVELGFNGVDINMGCPDKSVEKQSAGAVLIKNPKLARELIAAAKRGVKDKIPVSVKTRLGYNKDELEEWLPELLAENPSAITIHARTRKEMSKVPARWERVRRAVEIRNEIQAPQQNASQKVLGSPRLDSVSSESSEARLSSRHFLAGRTLIIGNGDVLSVEDAIKKCEETGADGAMLGRAVFGNPWLFANLTSVQQSSQIERPAGALAEAGISVEERLRVLIEHTKLFEEKLGGIKNFAVMKKHFKAYLKEIPNSKELLTRLMETKNAEEVEKEIKLFSPV